MSRVVILGGSNVSRGISIIFETARRIVAPPAEFLIAMGHGRSYGQRSRLMGRGLPGITESGLWSALSEGQPAETFALLTDVGNDVAYGVPIPQIARWVEWCLLRLGDCGARVVMTTLPLESLERLPTWHFDLARTIFYPGRPVKKKDAMARIADLNEGIRALGQAHGAAVVEQDLSWYGLDPIHIRRARLASAWGRIMSSWNGGQGPQGAVAGSPGRWLRLRLQTPPQWWLLRWQLGRIQPFKRVGGAGVAFF